MFVPEKYKLGGSILVLNGESKLKNGNGNDIIT